MSTHTLLFFAPVAAGLTVGASLQLLHVTREAFLFVSACMLTYSVRDLPGHRPPDLLAPPLRAGGGALPLLDGHLLLPRPPGRRPARSAATCCTCCTWSAPGTTSSTTCWSCSSSTPCSRCCLILLRRTAGHHGLAAARQRRGADRAGVDHALGPGPGVDAGLLGHARGHLVPVLSDRRHGGRAASRRVPPLALLARAAHRRRHAGRGRGRPRSWYYLAADHVASWLGSSADPFQPIVIPFNVGAIACIYLIGVALVDRRRSRRTRAVVQSGSDNSYGDLPGPAALHHDPELAGLAPPQRRPALAAGQRAHGGDRLRGLRRLTELLARTPLAKPLTGRSRVPWRAAGAGGGDGRSRVSPSAAGRQPSDDQVPPARVGGHRRRPRRWRPRSCGSRRRWGGGCGPRGGGSHIQVSAQARATFVGHRARRRTTTTGSWSVRSKAEATSAMGTPAER